MHRDFSKVIELPNNCQTKKFKIVSSNIDEKIIPNNVQLIKGDWNKNILSDQDIKKHKNSRLVFLPVMESLVTSGQSVAMQSMATGTPVVISKTRDFGTLKIL